MKRFTPVLVVALGACAAVSFAKGASVAPSPSRNVAIDITLRDLVGAIGAYSQKPEGEALKRINEDLTQISGLTSDHNDKTGDAETDPKIDQLLTALQPLIKDVLSAEQNREACRTRLDQLQRQAKGSIVALTLNQRPGHATPPQSLALMNQMENEISEMHLLEQRATAALYQIMELWKKISEIATESRRGRSETSPSEQPVRTGTPGPFALVVLIALTVLLVGRFAISEWTQRQILRPLEQTIRALEAAIAGDVSAQVPELFAGRMVILANAANRLIGVLARSQRLVYQLSTLVDASSEAIISQDMGGRIISWNKGAQRIYGYGFDEVRGKSVTMLATPDNAAELQSMIDAAARGDRVHPTELQLEGRNQRPARVILRVAALYASTKEVMGVSVWAQDITGPTPFRQHFPETRQEDTPLDQAA